MTDPTTHPEYNRVHQHYLSVGATPDEAATQTAAWIAQRNPKPNRVNPILLGVAVVAVIILGLGVTAVVMTRRPAPQPRSVGAQSVTSPDPLPSPEPPAKYTPVPTDFQLTVKVTEKQCFGSAGCHVSFRVDAAYGGLPLDEADEWLITYTVTGDESGPLINSFTLQGTTVTQDSEESMSPKSSKIVPKAVVTGVAPN